MDVPHHYKTYLAHISQQKLLSKSLQDESIFTAAKSKTV